MEMTDNEKQQTRFALDERIIYLLQKGLDDSAAIAYSAYLAVDGYHELDLFEKIAEGRKKE